MESEGCGAPFWGRSLAAEGSSVQVAVVPRWHDLTGGEPSSVGGETTTPRQPVTRILQQEGAGQTKPEGKKWAEQRHRTEQARLRASPQKKKPRGWNHTQQERASSPRGPQSERVNEEKPHRLTPAQRVKRRRPGSRGRCSGAELVLVSAVAASEGVTSRELGDRAVSSGPEAGRRKRAEERAEAGNRRGR